MQLLTLLLLSFLQSVTFTMSSRARNRSNYKYNLFCTVVSNSVWFLTLREVESDDRDRKLDAQDKRNSTTD